ncbi:SGNH/GDSL hydrolase family protein [Glutamicibacter sp. AOP5-A2-18]|uniref:SGNH/GDSL hydrolase family protein n=1 Tax=Glutamicibacter sp. AOP5-A2-18 TaxID=3457656 RepID=UPI004034BA01
MGRQINFNFRRGGGSAVEVLYGKITIEATRPYKLGASWVMPFERTIPLVNGIAVATDASITPPGPIPEWAHRVTVFDSNTEKTWTWVVGVPDGTTAINFNSLPVYEWTPPVEGDLNSIASDARNAAEDSEASRIAAEAAAALIGAPAGNVISAAITANGPARDSVYGVIQKTTNPALGAMFAGYARAQIGPVSHVYCGSSSTEGSDQRPADRWVNKLHTGMQAQYASGPGGETPVGDHTTQIYDLPGLHGYNFGQSGTTVEDYMPASKITRIGQIQPSLITHMVGSNDANLSFTEERYRNGLVAVLDQIDAVVTVPHVHVLIHAHQRQNKDITSYWDAYRKVLRELAETRSNVAFVDVSYDFKAIGIPGTDPLDYLKPDEVHLTPPGHDMQARLIGRALEAPVEAPKYKVVVKDDFLRANGPLGVADTGQPWRAVSGEFEVMGNSVGIVSPGTCLIESVAHDFDATLDIYHPGNISTLSGLVFWAKDNDNRMGVFIDAGSTQRIGVYTTIAGATGLRLEIPKSISAGWHTIRVVARSGALTIFLDGQYITQYTPSAQYYDPLRGNTKVGFRCGSMVPEMRWAKFSVQTR